MDFGEWYQKNSGWVNTVIHGILAIGSGILTGILAVSGLRSDLNFLKEWKDAFATQTAKNFERIEERQGKQESKLESMFEHIQYSLRSQESFNARQEERLSMMLELLKQKDKRD